MLGSLVGVSVIAKHLGANPLGQLFASLFCATIPMGILQAPSSQNDYVPSFWFVCMIDALLARQQSPQLQALSIGASLGLALLTKGTSYIFAVSLLLTLFLAKKIPLHTITLKQAGCIVVIALVLNTPHYIRNVDTFGFPLGPRNLGSPMDVGGSLTNETFSPAILISNLTRNVALHISPLPGFKPLVETVIERWHRWLGIDVNDPPSTLSPDDRFKLPGTMNDPASTGNPFHLLLIVLAIVPILISRQLRNNRVLRLYVVALIAAFVLFSSVLKWQPWHSRLHLPLFVLWSPVIGVLYNLFPKELLVAGFLLTVQAWSPLVNNGLYPLTGERSVVRTDRIAQYFRSFRDLKAEYVGAAEFLRSQNCREVGLLLGWDDVEHPLWALLPGLRMPGGRAQHIGVSNSSAHLERRSAPFTPCGVFSRSKRIGEKLTFGERSYRLAWSSNGVKVFLIDVTADPANPKWLH
jgi:4-amino-4-deoxy-L-arabinose transferase-like glycosyltransferase